MNKKEAIEYMKNYRPFNEEYPIKKLSEAFDVVGYDWYTAYKKWEDEIILNGSKSEWTIEDSIRDCLSIKDK